jgi:hypothetical protein
MRWWWGLLCTRPTCLVGYFIVLAHWHNRPLIDMLPHSDTLSWFWTNQSLLFLLNAECLVEMQQIPISQSLVWPDLGSNPKTTALRASTPPKSFITELISSSISYKILTVEIKLSFFANSNLCLPTNSLISRRKTVFSFSTSANCSSAIANAMCSDSALARANCNCSARLFL